MSGNIKKAIQDIKIRQCKKEHDKEVERQSDRYPQWILEEEPKKVGELYTNEPVGDMAAKEGRMSAAWQEKQKQQ